MSLAWVALLASLLMLTSILVGISVVADVEVLSDGIQLLLGTVDEAADGRHR